jgi:hypothetical protein
VLAKPLGVVLLLQRVSARQRALALALGLIIALRVSHRAATPHDLERALRRAADALLAQYFAHSPSGGRHRPFR